MAIGCPNLQRGIGKYIFPRLDPSWQKKPRWQLVEKPRQANDFRPLQVSDINAFLAVTLPKYVDQEFHSFRIHGARKGKILSLAAEGHSREQITKKLFESSSSLSYDTYAGNRHVMATLAPQPTAAFIRLRDLQKQPSC